MQHPRVGDLAGEGDADPGALRVGLDRGAAGREEDRAGARLDHRPDHRGRRRHRAEHAELERAADVLDARLEDRLHELFGGQRRVLEHLDRAEPLGQRADRRAERVGIADVDGDEVGRDPLLASGRSPAPPASPRAEIRPTLIPSRPKRRATAAPRLGPAPTITIDICAPPGRPRGAVLAIGHVLAPGHRVARVVRLLDRDVGHEAVGRGAVPMVLAGLEEDAVAGADLLDRAALAPAGRLPR